MTDHADTIRPIELRLKPGTIAKLALGPNDAIVLFCDRSLTKQQATTLTEQLRSKLGDERKVIILPSEFGLGVLKQP